MKIVVTCGSPWSNLHKIGALLQASGVQAAKAAKRDVSETIQAWHAHAVTAYSDNADALLCPVPIAPSKPWEQMATDIFAANADQACWGWADTKSTWFLDFWLNYDPHFIFVLVYDAPHKDFAKCINADDAEYNSGEFIQIWLRYNKELLKFYNRHSDRSVLLSYEACVNSPEILRKICGEKLGLNLTGIAPEQVKSESTLPLLELLALQILEPYQDAKELFAEMEASALNTIPAKGSSQNELLSEAISEYQNLRKHSQQFVIQQQENIHLVEDKLNLSNCLADMERERDVLNQAQQQLKQQMDEVQLQQQTAHKIIQQENELLLLQLHQVQEELEHCFVDNQSLIVLKEDLEKRIIALEYEREQLNQTQQQLSEAQHQSVQKEIQQENELLLLQLHQVQEELEHYFMEYQGLQSRNEEMASRWQRFYARFPDYYDYSAIEICDVDIKADYHAVKWRIDDLLQSNGSIPTLTFKTVVDNGLMGLLFEKGDENNSTASLLSWPLLLNGQAQLFINFCADQAVRSDAISNQCSKLAATDWIRVKTLLNVLADALGQENILSSDARSKIDVAYWLNVISVLRQAYIDAPAIFRFDTVSLYKEQVNPDYEHLWFKFKEVRFGDSYWPDFQFRLSAANVKREGFSVFPKLEFPLSDDKTLPFEKWTIEIEDAIGARMELRFALAPPAIDIQVWNSFVAHDQALIASILQQLPFILECVESQGSRISRPYDDWKNMVNEMQAVFKLLIEVNCPV
ncbi:MAG: hypothetical protein Q7U57_09980 [Methylovulum sp.]|nr:hypothetical protein [Methylovulum sp.]